ncbi:MAG: S9 family peptidase [Acidobacteria bacterium]|nr:S9 family peptidase [Acidobacteriota bacterium]
MNAEGGPATIDVPPACPGAPVSPIPRGRGARAALGAFAALLLLFGAVAQAGLPEIIPRRALFGDPDITSPAISPDGRLLAYCAPFKGHMNVWARTPGKTDDRPLTRFDRDSIGGFIWAYNNRDILFVSCRGGDENWHLVAVDTHAKNPRRRDLTPFRGVQARFLRISPRHPDLALVLMNRENRQVFDVYQVNLRSGRVTLRAKNPGTAIGWVADADLAVRGMETLDPDGGTTLFVRDSEGAPWKKLATGGPDESIDLEGFAPDGRSAWLLHDLGGERKAVVRRSLEDGSETVLYRPGQGDIVDVLVDPETGEPQAACVEYLRREWVPLDPSVKADVEVLGRIEEGELSVVSRSADGRYWVACYRADIGPVKYYLYDRSWRKAAFLFSNRPWLEKYTRARKKPVVVRSRDGLDLVCYLTFPVGVEEKGLPTVVLVHGGPWNRDSWGWQPDVQWLANRGYAVLQVNFRGSRGFGRTFQKAGDREWGGAMLRDILDALDWVVAQGIADPRRLSVMGASFGGYAALSLISFHPEVFVCGIDISGPSDLADWIRNVPEYWKPLSELLRRRVGDLEGDAEKLRESSPLFSLDRIRAPLLIAQGINDPRVRVEGTRKLVNQLKRGGKTVLYVEFPDEGHGFSLDPNALVFTALAEEFLARHLGGRWEPMSKGESQLARRVLKVAAPER